MATCTVSTLTVHFDGLLISSQLVLCVTLVQAHVCLLQLVNGQPQVSLVAFLLHGNFVLWPAYVNTFRLTAECPVVQGQWVRFNVTVQSYV